jgi:hypothetical protein
VKGNRFARAEVWRTMPQSRLLGNILLSLLTRPASGYWHLFDSQCGFTAATRQTLAALDLGGLFPGYGYPNDLLARLQVARARVVDVPVRPIYGPQWRSGISLKTAIYPVLFVVVRSFVWRLAASVKEKSATVVQGSRGAVATVGDARYRPSAPTAQAPLLRPRAPSAAHERRGRSAPGS